MVLRRLNLILGSIFLFFGGFGGFALGSTMESSMQDGVYAMSMVRIFLRGSHTHGLLLAMYNIVFGMLVNQLNLPDKVKTAASIIAALSLLLPIGLGLRGATEGSMMSVAAPVAARTRVKSLINSCGA